jgi:hypothetical protein
MHAWSLGMAHKRPVGTGQCHKALQSVGLIMSFRHNLIATSDFDSDSG